MTIPGRTLRKLRLLRGMKQSHLAEALGVTQATVSRFERNLLTLSDTQAARIQELLAAPVDPAQDAALRRLVESSVSKVHLICDRTHRLLAASAPRCAEWRAGSGEFLGRSLLPYASPEIASADDDLEQIGWHEGALSSTIVETGANDDPVLPILPGRVLWERIRLSDGSPARLVTTLP